MIKIIARSSYSNGDFKTYSRDVDTLSAEEETLCIQVAQENEQSLEPLRDIDDELYHKLRSLCIGRARRHTAHCRTITSRSYSRFSETIGGGVIPRSMTELEHLSLRLDSDL